MPQASAISFSEVRSPLEANRVAAVSRISVRRAAPTAMPLTLAGGAPRRGPNVRSCALGEVRRDRVRPVTGLAREAGPRLRRIVDHLEGPVRTDLHQREALVRRSVRGRIVLGRSV